jgi:hypothetical protein
MFSSLFGLIGDVANVVVAPIEVVASVARVVTKPLANTLDEVVSEVEDWSN